MPKPNRAAVNHPGDRAFLPVGREFKVETDGDSADAGAGRQTSLLIRIFYRVNGIPVAQVVYNGPATDSVGGGASRRFVNNAANTAPFRPDNKTVHSIRVVAWDHITKPANGAEHRTKISRFNVI